MSTPTEVRAQAIAIHALGYSCRGIEKHLRERFPNRHVPRYGTIARWVGRRAETASRRWGTMKTRSLPF